MKMTIKTILGISIAIVFISVMRLPSKVAVSESSQNHADISFKSKAIVHYLDGSTVSITNIEITYEFGQADNDPQGSFMYTPTRVTVPRLLVASKKADSLLPVDLPFNKISSIKWTYDDSSHKVIQKPEINLRDNTVLIKVQLNCKPIATKKHVFQEYAQLNADIVGGGTFSKYLSFKEGTVAFHQDVRGDRSGPALFDTDAQSKKWLHDNRAVLISEIEFK
jgi:hypothetical protein